jgi:hypothetical protein
MLLDEIVGRTPRLPAVINVVGLARNVTTPTVLNALGIVQNIDSLISEDDLRQDVKRILVISARGEETVSSPFPEGKSRISTSQFVGVCAKVINQNLPNDTLSLTLPDVTSIGHVLGALLRILLDESQSVGLSDNLHEFSLMIWAMVSSETGV